MNITSSIFLTFFAIGLFAGESFAANRVLQEAIYTGKYKGTNVEMNRRLIHIEGNKYILNAKVKNFFARISESEEFLWNKETGIMPLQYRYSQSIFGLRRKRKIDFDWQQGQATSTDKEKTKTIPISTGVLGPMSYQLKIQLDLINGKPVDEYHFVNRGKLKHYKFNALGMEQIDKTDITRGLALHIERISSKKDRSTSLWFDPENAFSVIMLSQEDKGDNYTLQLKKNHFYPPFDNTPFSKLDF